MSEQIELNDGHIHEAIDRISVSIDYLQATLAEHPLIASVDKFGWEVQSSIEILANLYQKIGAIDSVADLEKSYELRKGYKVRK
ncbi:MAG: hypothetical protein ACE5GL_06920 [Calditrichia bacterium]